MRVSSKNYREFDFELEKFHENNTQLYLDQYNKFKKILETPLKMN